MRVLVLFSMLAGMFLAAPALADCEGRNPKFCTPSYDTYTPPVYTIDREHGKRYRPEGSLTTTHDDTYVIRENGRPIIIYREKGRDHHTRDLP